MEVTNVDFPGSVHRWLYCVLCGRKYYWHPIRHPDEEICQVCRLVMSREEALAQIETFPHFHFCRCATIYGYEEHPTGLYKQWVCKNCHLPTWANNDAHKICLGCGDKYTIISEHKNKDTCPDCS